MREEVALFTLPDEGIGGGSCTRRGRWRRLRHARHVRLLPVDPRVKRLPSSLGSERRGLSLTLYELLPLLNFPLLNFPRVTRRRRRRGAAAPP